MVGERDMGDAQLDFDSLTYGWFDHFLKGEDNHVLETMPKVRYYVMGENQAGRPRTRGRRKARNQSASICRAMAKRTASMVMGR